MATAQDLIEAALREIGVLAASQTLPASEATDGLARLNRFLDRLAAENLSIYSITRTVATLTANQASFTVGPAGNINIARPVFIERVNFIDTSTSPTVEYQLGGLMTDDQWESIPIKSITSPYPQAAYYNPTYPTGTLYPWPIPTSATLQWVVYHSAAVGEIAALSTTVALPPGYAEMITQNLALMLCPSYERQPHPVLVKSAAESLATVKRANHRTSDKTFGADALGAYGAYGPAAWDIRTGP